MDRERVRYPAPDRAREVQMELLRNQAVEAYRVFYPSVSAYSFFIDLPARGAVVNQKHIIASASPTDNALTANSDTPYAPLLIDCTDGPVVVELPSGPILGIVDDMYFRPVSAIGLAGPDRGQGGKYLYAGPGYTGDLPADGYFVTRLPTNKVIILARSVPPPGHPEVGLEVLSQIKTYPLGRQDSWTTEMIDMTGQQVSVTSATRETGLGYWRLVHEVITSDAAVPEFHLEYGRLAALGIVKGEPFPADPAIHGLLAEASFTGAEQMAVQAFCDDRPARLPWDDRHWEWAAFHPDTAYDTEHYLDLRSRDKWFYQATFTGPAMFLRQIGVGSIYWAAYKDTRDNWLDGSTAYRLVLPAPVPAGQYWSLTSYNVRYRSQIASSRGRASISSLNDPIDPGPDGNITLYFGPQPPSSGDRRLWTQTNPGEPWFPYLRIYGPEAPAFDGTWRPGDLEPLT